MTSVIEVHIISNRPLLDEFINKWNRVNIDGETVIKVLSTSYDEKKFVLSNGIKVEYIKQKTFPKTTLMNQAWARNELLCYTDSKYVLFFDDWQRPDVNILIEHLKCLKQGYMVCGKRLECDKDGNNCKEDVRLDLICKHGDIAICDYGQFWTCNASASLDDIVKVNGFDNRYNGGSGGEDYDMAMRISKSGVNTVYNTNAICYHDCHDHIGRKMTRRKDDEHIHYHDLSPYKYLPEYKHLGDWNLMVSNDFEFWWEGPIKYFKCKHCGEIGILDSIQVYYYNRDNNVIKVENGLEQVRKNLICIQ